MTITPVELKACRISGSDTLIKVLSLGDQALTGRFPKQGEIVPHGPLDLVMCPDSGLVQLGHSYPASEMYGDNYGYRSGLNISMARHLMDTAHHLEGLVELNPHDVVLDIGSNDGTLLKGYHTGGISRLGIDPLADKFKEHYPARVDWAAKFFSARTYRDHYKHKAKIITSMAMFYDLEDPVDFARDVASILHDDGVWHFEQSYLPMMLRNGAYDTICHEHLEYYSLHAITRILRQADLRVIDVSFNHVNGGSFAVTAAHKDKRKPNLPVLGWVMDEEAEMGLCTTRPYVAFANRVVAHKQSLQTLLFALKHAGKRVVGYGASTKANVMLQYCDLGTDVISCIADVNEEKHGKLTPGTGIPIVSEEYARELRPDYMLVGPWHFRQTIIERERDYLDRGGRLIFPFPYVEIV